MSQAAETDLDLQTCPSGDQTRLPGEFDAKLFISSTDIHRKPRFLSIVTSTFDLDLQTRPCERPNVFPVNMGQICSEAPRDISHTNKKVTDCAKNRTLHSSLHVVTNILQMENGKNHFAFESLRHLHRCLCILILRFFFHIQVLSYCLSVYKKSVWNTTMAECHIQLKLRPRV